MMKLVVNTMLMMAQALTVMTAMDADSGGGGVVRFGFDDGADDSFSIDSSTGVVRIARALDFEQQQRFDVTARATDRGVPSLFSTCQLTIDIVDVDENLFAPKFDKYVFTAQVRENEPRGTEVTRLVAEDWDVENVAATERDYDVTYSITGGDGLGKFGIDDEGESRIQSRHFNKYSDIPKVGCMKCTWGLHSSAGRSRCT